VHIFIEKKQRLGHKCALEFGGGPTLFSSFLLAQYVDSIHFTDYTPSNLKAVEDWINQVEHAHDWTDLFESIMQEYQQQASESIYLLFHLVFGAHFLQSGEKTANLLDWEQRLRCALKRGGLSQCGDINDSYCPVLDGESNINQNDIILSSLCLEDACLTHNTYKATIKRFSALLKPGGFIFLTHGRNQTFYSVIGKHFFALSINEASAREALEQAGFVDIHVTSVEKPRSTNADADGFLLAYAYKP